MTDNIFPAETPDTLADTIVRTTWRTIQTFPTIAVRITRLAVGPAFDALDQSFAAIIEELRKELNLMGATVLQIAAEKEQAETRAATLELRVAELHGGDDLIQAVRKLYARRENLLTERLKRVDLEFAKCRDDRRELQKRLDEAARERTGAARYIVELEDRIRELEEGHAA